ncbi:hypothetical protein RKLH11_208 [Rhodobacteraceae bacterium KLH11]|nr:hypothetical protein RKLH11_208 [Rhodobacteraceae bacterium KLH11]
MNTRNICLSFVAFALSGTSVLAVDAEHAVSDSVIAQQRAALAAATENKGFGPQAPRDISVDAGNNRRAFSSAPAVAEMTLCDIHFHENAEHKGGEFTTFAGNGDGHGNGTGFKYNGTLTKAELAPVGHKVGVGEHGDLEPGDTIEIHYVYSTAKAEIGHGLGTCLSDAIKNPQLRVEAVVAVLVNDPKAADFGTMTQIAKADDLNQVPNLPNDLGTPVVYEGSTTGPGYNEEASPFQVTWSVRPEVVKVDIGSVEKWLADNPFDEDHAHGVRNLVINPDLLSQING